MPALKEVFKLPGRNLAETVLYRIHSALNDESEEESVPTIFDSPFAEWAGKPIEFCEKFLNVEFTEDVKDMVTSAQENPTTLAKSANGTGKTHAAACFVVYWYLVYADAMVFTLAAPPLENLSLLLWGEIGAIVERFPHLFAGHKISLAGLHIERHRKSFITGLAIPQSADPAKLKSRFSGKHAPHLLFVADEGDGVEAEIYEAIDGCMSGGMARLLILFNPRAESGPVYLMEAREQGNVVTLGAFSHPNVMTGKDLIPGAVTRNTTVRRIMEQTIPLRPGQIPDKSCFQVPSYLVGVVALSNKGKSYPPLQAGWRRIVSPEFSYMVLGIYPTQAEDQLISGDWVDAAFSRYEVWRAVNGDQPPRGIRPYTSLDVADIIGKDSNVFTAYFGSFVPPQKMWTSEDVVQVGDTAANFYAEINAQWCNVDATGVGAGAWAQMKRRRCKAYRIMVGGREDLKKLNDNSTREEELVGFENIRAQMLWYLREWLRADTAACLAPDSELREELIAPRYWKDTKRRVCVSSTDAMKLKLRRSPDRLMSLGLRWAVQPKDAIADLTTHNYAYTRNPKIRVKSGLGLGGR